MHLVPAQRQSGQGVTSLLDALILKNCPKCRGDKRYWHKAGVFLVTNPSPEQESGGMAPSAAVICPDCGLIEFYAQTAEILQQIPEALVATETGPTSQPK